MSGELSGPRMILLTITDDDGDEYHYICGLDGEDFTPQPADNGATVWRCPNGHVGLYQSGHGELDIGIIEPATDTVVFHAEEWSTESDLPDRSISFPDDDE